MTAVPTENQPDTRSIGEREFVVLMAMIMALPALATDAMLPALGVMANDLGAADANDRQLVIGIYLLAAGIGALFPGALADRFGRRPVLFAAFTGYFVFTIACALVQDFNTLLVLRALQALSSVGLTVMPGALVRDRFVGDRMARATSTITVVFMLVPMIAPNFGQAVIMVTSWRWIFGGMALMAALVGIWAWLRLPETLDPAFRQAIDPATIARNMLAAATTRSSAGYVFGGAMMSGAMFGYLNSSQQLIGEHFGAGDTFPLFFALMAAALAVANLSNARIVEHFGARRLSHLALLVFIAVSAVQVWSAHRAGQGLWEFIVLMTVNICLMGFIGANFSAIAMQPFARIAGAAASCHSALRLAGGALLGGWVGQAYDNSARPLGWALLLCGLATLALVLWSEQGRLFRRLNPPGTPRPVADPPLR